MKKKTNINTHNIFVSKTTVPSKTKIKIVPTFTELWPCRADNQFLYSVYTHKGGSKGADNLIVQFSMQKAAQSEDNHGVLN